MTDSNTQKTISGLVQYGLELLRTNKVDLDRLITSDRLMVEIYCDDTIAEPTKIYLNNIYCKYENHIHDTIESAYFNETE